jgi:hypothetical protein
MMGADFLLGSGSTTNRSRSEGAIRRSPRGRRSRDRELPRPVPRPCRTRAEGKVLLRGPELVFRWGVYSGITAAGVDVPWEGGSNNNVGSATIREIAKSKANAMRILGGVGNELDAILNTAIVEQKMFAQRNHSLTNDARYMATTRLPGHEAEKSVRADRGRWLVQGNGTARAAQESPTAEELYELGAVAPEIAARRRAGLGHFPLRVVGDHALALAFRSFAAALPRIGRAAVA